LTTPSERAFAFFERGSIRDDIILLNFRLGLAQLIDPETGALFTQDKIAQATQQGSMFWREADAIDLYGMAAQARGLTLADQVRIDRANSNFLVNYHGDLWDLTPLPASGGSGPVTTNATPGTIYTGSVVIPDPGATTFRDQANLRYQVLLTTVTPGSGVAELTLVAIDTGEATNLPAGTVLVIDQNPPIGAQPNATVEDDFRGGFPDESMADFAARIKADVRHKPGAGNNPQFRSWARASSTAIRDGYVYACAMHAGSTFVCITQKRGKSVGPNALQATAGVLAQATAYLVPPASPVVPPRAFIVVTTFTPAPADTIVQLSQSKGSPAGWANTTPWPGFTGIVASIGTVTDQTHFRMHSDTALPGGAGTLSGANAPRIMVWDVATSRFEKLLVTSITSAGANNYDVVLTQAPNHVLAIGDWISPDMARRVKVAEAAEAYFDSLGPGEVVNLATDVRADRAARFPDPAEEAPSKGGQAIVATISDVLGYTLAAGSLFSMSITAPPLPADVVLGPAKLTLGKFAVFDLP
jgi:uncharacterized phage protein gp47/JayE